MADSIRKTDLKELAGEMLKSGPERKAAKHRHVAGASAAVSYSGARKAGKSYRRFRKNEWTDMDGIPVEIIDSLVELDSLVDKLELYGTEDGFGEDVRFNECYFDAARAQELVSGINYRLNRLMAGEKRNQASEKKSTLAVQADRLYGLTGALEENLKTLKDSLEREHGLGSRAAEQAMAGPVLKKASEEA